MYKFLAAFFFSLPMTIFSQKNIVVNNEFTIIGSIQHLKENDLISVVSVNNATDTIAKARVQHGKFMLKGALAEPDLYQINFHGAQKKTLIFLDNSRITMDGDISLLKNIKIVGSISHDNFIGFQETFNPLVEKVDQLSKIADEFQGDKNRTDSMELLFKSLVLTIESKVDSFILVKRDQAIAPFTILVTAELSQNVSQLQKRFALLSDKQQKSFYGDLLKKQIDEASFAAIGTPAIEFSQNDTNGVAVHLSSFKGKYVLIDFWASWCRPCRMENPNVVKAYDKFHEKNFTVLGVSLDRAKNDWLEAIAADGLKWTQVSDLKYWNNAAAQLYRIQSIPQNILIDPQGIIVGKNLRGEALEATLCQLLGCDN